MGQNNKEGVEKAFQTIFGEEHSGAVRCYGRNVTKTSLKRKEEINALKKAHNEEVTALHGKMHNMEDKIGRLEYAFKVLFPVFYCLLGGMFLLQIHDGSIYVVLYCTIGLCS